MTSEVKLIIETPETTDLNLLAECIGIFYKMDLKTFRIQDVEKLDDLRVLVLVVPYKKRYEEETTMTDNSFVCEIKFGDESLVTFTAREKARFTPRPEIITLERINVESILGTVFKNHKKKLSEKNIVKPEDLKRKDLLFPSLEGTIFLYYSVEKKRGDDVVYVEPRLTSFKKLDATNQIWGTIKSFGSQISEDFPTFLNYNLSEIPYVFQIILSSDKTRSYTTGIKEASIFISHTMEPQKVFGNEPKICKVLPKVIIQNGEEISTVMIQNGEEISKYGKRKEAFEDEEKNVVIYENAALYEDSMEIFDSIKVYDFPEFKDSKLIWKSLQKESFNGIIIDLTVIGIRAVYFFPRPKYTELVKKYKPHYRLGSYQTAKLEGLIKENIDKKIEGDFELLFDFCYATLIVPIINGKLFTLEGVGGFGSDEAGFGNNKKKYEIYLTFVKRIEELIGKEKSESLEVKDKLKNKIDKQYLIRTYEKLFL